MAKCKGCGKRGLFLKLQNGLCNTCIDKLFPAETGPFGLTKDMFLNPEKYAVEEEPIKRNLQNEISGMITADDGSKIPVELLPSFYNFDGIKIIDSNLYEIVSVPNIDRARVDIESLNEYIDKAKRICKTFPDLRFKKESLNFKFDPLAFTRNYCTLSFSPLTKTGKLPSYPIVLHIVQGEHFLGKILYDSIGNIARAEISALTMKGSTTQTSIRQDCTSHKIIIAKQDGELCIRLIYRSYGGNRKKVYDSKPV